MARADADSLLLVMPSDHIIADVSAFHAAIAKNHPRLFAAHADLYDIAPEQGVHPEPAVIFRGTRCLRCEQIVADPATIIDGLGPECR